MQSAAPIAAAPTTLRVEGMTCNNCARKVTAALQALPGVSTVKVSVEAGRATVRWAAGPNADAAALIEALSRAGFPASVLEAEASGKTSGSAGGWKFNLWLGVICTTPLLLGEWVFRISHASWFQWLAVALASVVHVVAGAQFYRGAWRQLKVGASSMDTLVALGSTTAYTLSVWLLFSGAGGHLFFLESSAIITLISVGHWLEARVAAQASSALKSLLDLAPATALRRGADGRETETSVAELRAGDLVVLKPGSRVPVDGAVAEGHSAVDESMLTGESLPVDKAPGAALFAGTANLNGRLVQRVTATGEATALARIIEAVERAQSSRANIQRLADRVSNVFVPVVVMIALATALAWGLTPAATRAAHDWLGQFLWAGHVPASPLAAALIAAAAVLIVACPCAMGLATPAAIMAGANAAARRGILIRDGIALEKAGLVTAVLLDKTGTLTLGKPAVAGMWKGKAESGKPKAETLAAALARNSAHPLSQAVAKLSAESVSLEEWREVRGSGVQALLRVAQPTEDDEDRTEEIRLRLGSLAWLESLGVDTAAAHSEAVGVPASGPARYGQPASQHAGPEAGAPVTAAQSFVGGWSAKGASVLGFSMDRRLVAAFALTDSLKPHAAEVIRQLQRGGLKTFLVTGDNAATAASVAALAGIPAENVFASVRPEAKAELVKQLQRRGERVAFVGDGINDAPALTQADLGIAVSRASDVAREAADIVLLNSEIEAVPEALALARATLRTIRQNLFWAFFYNAAAVPLAALGFLSPVVCAAAMGMSDLIVIGNALRLRGRR